MPRRLRQKRRRFSRLIRPARHRLLTPLLEAVRRVVAMLPHSAALFLGTVIGYVLWIVAFRMRRLAHRHLVESNLDVDAGERHRIVRRMFLSVSRGAIESLNASGWTAGQCRKRVQFDHPDIIREQHALGRGVIILTGHIGNWELVAFNYAVSLEHPLSAVMASTRNERLTAWILKVRAKLGYTIITTEEGALPLLRRLRRGEAVGILADQDTTRARGTFVQFFGRPAYTPIGPALLALRAKCPIIPVAISRDAADPTRHTVRVGTPVIPDPAADESAEIQRMTQAFTRQLEGFIRETPEQWVWFHERWRHQPGKKVRVRQPRG